jgi:hypothetical protein
MVAVIVVVAAAAAVASYLVHPSKAKAFDLYYGTATLNDNTIPVVVDLASGKPTVKLNSAEATVSAPNLASLDIVNLQGGGLLLNTVSGEFNMLDSTGFVVKSGGGVSLPKLDNSAAEGVAAGTSAYILQKTPSQTEVYLVNQSTVAAASGRTSAPRAYASIAAAVASTAGSAASANGDLWLLTSAGLDGVKARRLHVPTGSSNGVQLDSADFGTFPAVSALATMPVDASDAASPSDVVIASTNGVVLIDPSGRRNKLHVDVPGDADRILPATNDRPDSSRAQFLYHSPSGWTLVSASSTGDASVRAVTGIDATAQLAQPAFSRDALYTMNTTYPGDLWRIDSHGAAAPVAGMATYPRVNNQNLPDLSGTEVRAYGSRVIFNNRFAYGAVTVFADGSLPPVTIDKPSAVNLSSTGGIEALTASHTQNTPNNPQQPQQQPQQQRPVTQPVQTINENVNCTTTSQLPHQPVLLPPTRASRSLQLTWQYTPLSTQDCWPTTYSIQATTLDRGAPKAPSYPPVQGQTGATITGLFPDTQYRIVVTAFINGRGTASEPLLVSTSPEGPPAPTEVSAHPDNQGNWTLTWNSCGGLADTCVPTNSWRIVPSFCDGRGLSSPPAAIDLPGDPTLHSFSYTYPGSAALLGRGLSFQVEGIGQTGLIGESAAAGCSSSWASPNTTGVTVTASTPAKTSGAASGASSTTTVTVAFAGDENVALGGVGGQIGYVLLSGGTQVDSKGPTDATSVTFSGLRPGQRYQVQVTLYPPGHPEAAATLAPVNVDAAISDWPTIGVSVASPAYPDYRTASLSVTISGISSSDARGETFDLVNSSLTCGNASKTLTKTNFDPGSGSLTFGGIDRATYNGSCTVSVQLTQNPDTATSPSVYGATPSNSVSANVSIDPPALSTTRDDFTALWSTTADGRPAITVSYTGNNALLLTKSTSWSVQAVGNGSADCGTANDNPPPTQVRVSGACIQNGDTITASVSFTYYGNATSFANITVSGNAPAPLNLAASDFTATWAADASHVTLSTSADVSGGTTWDLVLTDGTTGNCGEVSVTSLAASTDIQADQNCVLASQTATTWKIVVSYVDQATGNTKSVDVPLDPPPAVVTPSPSST